MADTKSKSKQKSDTTSKVTVSGVTFKCRLCEKQKPISEIKVVRRFRPVLFVCQDCEKSL